VKTEDMHKESHLLLLCVQQGAPSLVHSVPGAVGAADLLQAGNAEVLLTDVAADPAVVAAHVIEMLDEGERLLHVARRAAERARSW